MLYGMVKLQGTKLNRRTMKCSLGIKDPWYIKSLDMVPSAKNPEILEMKVGVDFLEGSKASKTSTIYIKKSRYKGESHG